MKLLLFIRHLSGPDDWMSEPALHSKKPWRAVLARRRWRSGYNAGGGPGYIGDIIQPIQIVTVTLKSYF